MNLLKILKQFFIVSPEKPAVLMKETPTGFSLEDFLQARKFEEHLQSDFSTTITYPVTQKGNNQFVVELNGEDILFGKLSDDGTAGRIDDDAYRIIAATWPGRPLAHNRGLICEDNNNMLILPLFFSVFFYKQLNVFVCATITVNAEDQQNGIYNLFYFDIKGRFLLQDKGHYHQRPPVLAFLNTPQQELIRIQPLPAGHYLQKIVAYNLFIVANGGSQLGLVDNNSNLLLDCIHEKIIIEPPFTYAIIETNGQVFRFDIITKNQSPLLFNKIADTKNGLIRVLLGTDEDHMKWGISDTNGNTVLNAVYDHVGYTYSNNRFKVFTGNYEWILDDAAQDDFDKYLDPNSFKQDEFIGRLGEGKWGIVDRNGHYIVPAEYDWIEELSEQEYLLNKEGLLYSYYNGDAREDELAVVGGNWSSCDINGQPVAEINNTDIDAVIQQYAVTNTADFNKRSGEKACKKKRTEK